VALEASGEGGECAKAVVEFAPKLPRTPAFVNIMRAGLSSAGNPEQLKVLEPLAHEALQVADGFADDKADIYSSLIRLERSRKDTEAVKKTASEMMAFLEEGADARGSSIAR
jgi:hypothetical protein